MMSVLLRLFLINGHATLVAGVGSFALVRFVFHDADARYLYVTVDAGDHDVWAGSLMQVDVLAEALRAARVERLALDGLVLTC